MELLENIGFASDDQRVLVGIVADGEFALDTMAVVAAENVMERGVLQMGEALGLQVHIGSTDGDIDGGLLLASTASAVERAEVAPVLRTGVALTVLEKEFVSERQGKG